MQDILSAFVPYLIAGLVFGIAFYIYLGITLSILARKTGTAGAGMAWVPILNMLLMCRIARKSGAFVLLFFVPLVNFVAIAMVWMSIARVRGKSPILGLLVLLPPINLLVPAMMASGPGGASPPSDTVAITPAPLAAMVCSACGRPECVSDPNEEFCGFTGQPVRPAATAVAAPVGGAGPGMTAKVLAGVLVLVVVVFLGLGMLSRIGKLFVGGSATTNLPTVLQQPNVQPGVYTSPTVLATQGLAGVANPAGTPGAAGAGQLQVIGQDPNESRIGKLSGNPIVVSNDGANSPSNRVPTGTGVAAGGACVPSPPSLVSWLPADGNASDSTGGNNGTLQGSANYATGKVGQAFQFDGTSAYVQVGNRANLRLTSGITIEAWINPRSLRAQSAGQNMGAIVTKWAQNGGDVADSDSYGLWLIQNGGNVSLFSAIHQAGGSGPHMTGGYIPLNAWSHVAMTFDAISGSYVLYVNGQVANSATAKGAIFATNQNVQIGREDSYLARVFDGFIDEAAIFSRALSASEIQAIFNADSAGKCKK